MDISGVIHKAQQRVINTLLLKKDLFQFLDNLALAQKPIDHVSLLEGRFWLVNHPDLVRDVLMAKEQEISKPEFLVQSNRGNYGDGLTSLAGDAWAARRSASARAFTPTVLKKMQRDTRSATIILIRSISQPSSPVDLSAAMLDLVIRSSARWILSADVDSGDFSHTGNIPSVEAFGAWHRLDVPGVASDLMPSCRIRADETSVLRRIIKQKWQGHKHNTDYISAFYSSCLQQGLQLSEDDVFDEITQLLFASHHTVVTTLINCMGFLHQYPQAKAQVQKCALSNRKEAFQGRNDSKYTECFIKEVMRLCMPTALMFREVQTPLDIGGEVLSAGDLIVISPYLLQRDARYFPSPKIFDPLRFIKQINNFAYLPFGAGARRCVAHHLALTQMKTVLETIVLNADITPIAPLNDNLFTHSYPGAEYHVTCKTKEPSHPLMCE